MTHDELIAALAESSAWCAKHQDEIERLRAQLTAERAETKQQEEMTTQALEEVERLRGLIKQWVRANAEFARAYERDESRDFREPEYYDTREHLNVAVAALEEEAAK